MILLSQTNKKEKVNLEMVNKSRASAPVSGLQRILSGPRLTSSLEQDTSFLGTLVEWKRMGKDF